MQHSLGIFVLILVFALSVMQSNVRFINHHHGNGQRPHTHAHLPEETATAGPQNHPAAPHDHDAFGHHVDDIPVWGGMALSGDFHWHFFNFSLTSLASIGVLLSVAFVISRLEPLQDLRVEGADFRSFRARGPPLYSSR